MMGTLVIKGLTQVCPIHTVLYKDDNDNYSKPIYNSRFTIIDRFTIVLTKKYRSLDQGAIMEIPENCILQNWPGTLNKRIFSIW